MFAAIVVALGLATVVGMLVLWPGNVDARVGEAIVQLRAGDKIEIFEGAAV